MSGKYIKTKLSPTMLQFIFQDYIWYVALIHLGLAILLFFIVNWIGERSISVGYMQMSIVIQEDSAPAFNFLFKVLAPVVYLILCAVTFQALKIDDFVNRCYFIVVYYWAFRVLWILMTSRRKLTNWLTQILYWICSIGLSLGIYSVIEDVGRILPEPRALLDQIWILIIAFIYSVFNKVELSRDGTIRRKNNYIRNRYIKFHQKYDHIIKGFFHNNFYEAITYSIMIYEDFNRPFIIRRIENLRFRLSKKTHTLGVMQIKTDKYIDDAESIKLAIKKIAHDNNERLEQERPEYINSDLEEWIKDYILEQYNGGSYKYSQEVSEIYLYLVKEFYNNDIPANFSKITITDVKPSSSTPGGKKRKRQTKLNNK